MNGCQVRNSSSIGICFKPGITCSAIWFALSIALGQIFQFTVTSGSQRNVYYITAGPPAQGGNCVLAGNFPVNTQVMIQETPQFFFRPSQITVNEGQLMACTPPSIYCTVASTIPGITEVTFTNRFGFGKGVH